MAPTMYPLQSTTAGVGLIPAEDASSIDRGDSIVENRRDTDCATWNCYSSSTRLGIILSAVMISAALVWMYWHLIIKPRRKQEPVAEYELHAVAVDPPRENSTDRASFPPHRCQKSQLRASPARQVRARPVSWWSAPPSYYQPISMQPPGGVVFPPPPPPPPGTYTAPNADCQPRQSHDGCPPVAPFPSQPQPHPSIPRSQTHPQMYQAGKAFHTRSPQPHRLLAPGQVATGDGPESGSGQVHPSETVGQRSQNGPFEGLESGLQPYKTPTTSKRVGKDDITPFGCNDEEEGRGRQRHARFSRQLSISPLQRPRNRLRRTRVQRESSPRAGRRGAMEPRRRARSQMRHREGNQRAQRTSSE